MPATLSGDNVSLSMVKPIFILSGDDTMDVNLVLLLNVALFSQNVFRSGVLVRLYPSHNWLSVLKKLKIASSSMTNKTLPFATILLRSAERDGVADAVGVGVGVGAGVPVCVGVGVGCCCTIGSDFFTKAKYPTTPTRTTITPIKTIFANPF